MTYLRLGDEANPDGDALALASANSRARPRPCPRRPSKYPGSAAAPARGMESLKQSTLHGGGYQMGLERSLMPIRVS